MSQTIISSGSVQDRTISGGQQLYVEQSGSAISSSVDNDGTLIVVSGGSVSFSTVNLLGTLDVMVGGTASASILNNGGLEMVETGGMAAGVIVDQGGELDIYGAADSIVVASGGLAFVKSGGMQRGMVVSAGGLGVVQGAENGAQLRTGGELLIDNGGNDTSTTVGSGGFMQVFSGGTASDTTVQKGGIEFVSPDTTAGGKVQSGGTLIVAQPDIQGFDLAAGAHVISGGIVLYNALNGTVSAGTHFTSQILSGAAELEIILSGGIASETTLQDDASANIYAGGRMSGGYVASYGGVEAFSGGTIYAVTAGAEGTLINSGGTSYYNTVGDGTGSAAYLIELKGTDYRTIVKAGGEEAVVLTGTALESTISSGGVQFVSGQGSATSTTILSGGLQVVEGGGVVNFSTIAGGGLEFYNITGSGGVGSGAIDFVGGGEVYLQTTTPPLGLIFGFDNGAKIDLYNLNYSAGDSVVVGFPGEATIVAGGADLVFDLAGVSSNTPLQLSAGADGGVVLTNDAPCFTAGTRILTPRGQVPVETLAVGDLVITNDGEDAPIIWIGRRRIEIARHSRPERVRPVRIAADALGDGVPSRDLLLSPDHAVFFNDALIPAKMLINGRNICQLERAGVTYFHVELAQHGVIFAEDCAVETYLETGNRAAFENGGAAVALHPDFAQTLREQQSCAPFVTDGPVLDAARARTLRQFYVARRALG